MGRRIHITGASGSGTSALARGLAEALASQNFDTDDFYWFPTDPPFQAKRPVAARLALMQEVFLPRSDWVLSGSIGNWGEPVVARLTHVVFLTLDAERRMSRLAQREARRRAGGADPAFLEWAAHYDDPRFPGRSRRNHEAWIARLTCPVLRLDGARTLRDLVDDICATLGAARQDG